jgi:hypothetical protein
VFDFGRVLGGVGRRVAALFGEADGVIIRLQREANRLMEAKLAIVHEGWEWLHLSSSRFRLKGKLVYASIQGTRAFWESVTVLVARRWGRRSRRGYPTGPHAGPRPEQACGQGPEASPGPREAPLEQSYVKR